MASSTFQGIQRYDLPVNLSLQSLSCFCVSHMCVCNTRVAESTEEVTKLRPVRLIREDGIIRPYDPTESQGLDLFQVRLSDFFTSVSGRKLCPLGLVLS